MKKHSTLSRPFCFIPRWPMRVVLIVLTPVVFAFHLLAGLVVGAQNWGNEMKIAWREVSEGMKGRSHVE